MWVSPVYTALTAVASMSIVSAEGKFGATDAVGVGEILAYLVSDNTIPRYPWSPPLGQY